MFYPAGFYLFKVNNENTMNNVWNLFKVNNKRHDWRSFCVFIFVDFQQVNAGWVDIAI